VNILTQPLKLAKIYIQQIYQTYRFLEWKTQNLSKYNFEDITVQYYKTEMIKVVSKFFVQNLFCSVKTFLLKYVRYYDIRALSSTPQKAQSRQRTRLFFQSSELGPPPPHTHPHPQASVTDLPPLVPGGGTHSLAGEGMGVGTQFA
jgi:hypothetical protein